MRKVTRVSEQKSLPYPAHCIYEMVADVESYPDFLPWCRAVRIVKRGKLPDSEEGEQFDADMVVSFGPVRDSYRSQVECRSADFQIDTRNIDGPFQHMRSRWLFKPLDKNSCQIEFFIEFSFRSRLLQKLVGSVFEKAMHKIVNAFELRAAKLYGAHD